MDSNAWFTCTRVTEKGMVAKRRDGDEVVLIHITDWVVIENIIFKTQVHRTHNQDSPCLLSRRKLAYDRGSHPDLLTLE
jgi:hypothetical protein